jgi:hypothetical protein
MLGVQPRAADERRAKMGATGGKVSDVSFEIGASYVPMDGGLPGLSDAEKQVFACLHTHRAYIVQAERDFGVSRLAIAGAIAWEMLENPRKWSPRSAGFGKVHLYNYRFGFNPIDADTAAKQAEDAGYLPAKTYDERKLLLSMPPSAIRYIAALMAAIADLAARYGFEDIRDNPEILTNVYQSKDLKQWEGHLKAKPAGTSFTGGNKMDIWVTGHLKFLTAAVGDPKVPPAPAPAPSIAAAPPGAAKSVEVFKGLTLSDLAHAEYGDWELWPLIHDQNKALIGTNPNRLRIGQVLTVAPLRSFKPAQIADAKKRAPSWKKFT